MNELIERIHKLRDEEGIPIHFRRGGRGLAFWYVYYGYTLIAYKADQETASHAVDVAVIVHNEIHKDKAKAA